MQIARASHTCPKLFVYSLDNNTELIPTQKYFFSNSENVELCAE